MLISTAMMLAWLQLYSWAYGVEYHFARAVATIESGMKWGPLNNRGTLAGPMGIRRSCCIERLCIDPIMPQDNIRIGVRALRGPKIRALHRYNPKWREDHYQQDVMRLWRQYKREERIK